MENENGIQCQYCDNDADDFCERCGVAICTMHTIYDVCPACAIVGFITRFDECIHVMVGNVNTSHA
jgi:hypothetical protein